VTTRSVRFGWLVLLSLSAVAWAAPGPADHDPAGEWKIVTEGQKGKVTIAAAPRGDRRYDLHWQGSAGAYDGLGLLRDGHLLASWGRDFNGVMVLRREGPGYTAEWLGKNQNDEHLGAERWRGQELAGTHSLEGTHPNGHAYTGSVAIEKAGDVYKFTWHVGDQTYEGVGLEVGQGRLVIAYGHGAFGCMDYDLSGGDEILGRWAAQNDQHVSTERLRRKR
jgi:hypothetical protein